jgi:hypothetical protein
MKSWLVCWLVLLSFTASAAPRVLEVTRLDDDVRSPQPGMFRWAMMQRGERRVEFKVAGDVMLRDRVQIRHGSLTVDGSSAPAQGVCIRGGSLEFENAADVVLRFLRIRLGDETTRARLKREKRSRPKSSISLDCVELRGCRNVVIEHCSFSWSCDELLSISRSHNVTIRDCILSEPLGHKRLHPYGDEHAYALLASASTLTVERCLFAHFVMRGPQFEANDLRRRDQFQVKMVAKDNVVFDYKRSGSRYTTGPEDYKTEARGKTYQFTFQDNLYIAEPTKYGAIERVEKHGVHPGVKVTIKGNTERLALDDLARKPWLTTVGCSHQRDAADLRILENLRTNRHRPTIDSQRDVGGWPDLTKVAPSPAETRPSLLERLFR